MTPRFPGIKRVLHFAFGRRGLAAEIDEEIAFHFDEAMVELRSRGMSEREAREEVERRFGSVPEYKAALTRIGEARRADIERKELFDTVKQHLAFAWRGVRHRPWFALTVALTLALGIGANSVMFGVIDRLLFRAPEQIQKPEQVRRLFPKRAMRGIPDLHAAVAIGDVELMQRGSSHIEVAGYSMFQQTYGEGLAARVVPVGLVTSRFFHLLGTQPVLGRFFTPSDDSASANNAAVILGYDVWQDQFHGDHSVLGKVITVTDVKYTVIGVAPQGFTGAGVERVDLWLPLYPASDVIFGGPHWRTWDQLGYHILVRLPARVGPAAASAELLSVKRSGPPEKDPQYQWQGLYLASLIPAQAPDRGKDVPIALWLAATSIVLLVIACANVAALLLSRAVQRRRESAVRLALGIGRARLVAHLLAESALLALAGGIGALLITALGSSTLRAFLLPRVAWPTATLSGALVFFTLALSLGTGLVAGLVPALIASRPDLLGSLKSGAGGGTRRSRLQGGLIVVQAALSVALLTGAGLFVESVRQVRAIDFGFDAQPVMLAFPDFPPELADQQSNGQVDQAARILASDSRVESVAVSTAAPLSILSMRSYGVDSLKLAPTLELFYATVSPDYFRTIGTRISNGRGFTSSDDAGGPRVAVVSAGLAHHLYPGKEPVGRCLGTMIQDYVGCTRIIGIAADTHWANALAAPPFAVYLPLSQIPEKEQGPHHLILRVRGDPRSAVDALRPAVLGALSSARSVEMMRLQAPIDSETRSWRLGATLFLVFGALALVVAAIGLYSVMACRVEQRRHEMGVRSALGAEWGDLIRLVVGEGVLLVAVGVGLGLLVALAAAPAIAPLLYQTSPRDPSVLAIVSAVLLAAAAVACLVPAVRASRVDPLEALKAE